MMRQPSTLIKPLILIIGIVVISAMRLPEPILSKDTEPSEGIDTLKQRALEILQNKCNVCHRRQNPFKVFSEKNMEKHASKIHNQVFVKRRMPKGEIKLTAAEYTTLKNWLSTQKLK